MKKRFSSRCGNGNEPQDAAQEHQERIKKLPLRWRKDLYDGISQFAEHGSLDNCREGFLEGLKEEGIEEGKNLTVSMQRQIRVQQKQISDSFVSDKLGSDLCKSQLRSIQFSDGFRNPWLFIQLPGCGKACKR